MASMANTACRRFRGAIALLAGEELGPRRTRRLCSHLGTCGSCRALHGELQALKGLAPAWRLDEAEARGFRPVGAAVRARLATPAAPAAVSGLWSVAAPVAATLLAAAFLLVGRGEEPRPAAPQMAAIPATFQVSPGEDAHQAVVTLSPGKGKIHRIAVSRESSSFARAQVFQVSGGSWVDQTPLPEPGGIVFYRVD